MFGVAVFEAIEVKGRSMFNLEVTTSKILIISESLAADLDKGAVFCMSNGSEVLFFIGPQRLLYVSNAKKKDIRSHGL